MTMSTGNFPEIVNGGASKRRKRKAKPVKHTQLDAPRR